MYRDITGVLEDVEELRLQDDVVNHVRSELQAMRAYMIEIPRMGDWDIGYLRKG